MSRPPRRWLTSGPACRGALCLLVALLAFAAACRPEPEPSEPEVDSRPRYVETGDLPRLRARGELRILMPYQDPTALPRRGYTLDLEETLARRLAVKLRLRPRLMFRTDRSEMLEALLRGRGDLVVARLTVTEERRKRFLFSVPVDHVREWLICRADDPRVSRLEDLAGMQVAVRKSSSYFETLEEIRRRVPELEIILVPEFTDTEELLYRVAKGEYEATVADEDIFREASAYLTELRAAIPLTEPRPIAWAMRPNARALKEAVDRFLYEQALTRHLEAVYRVDLEGIRERQVLRVLTLNSPTSYFLYRGEQMGFEFELARRFARRLGCRLQVIVPPSSDDLVPWLLKGRGDLIAANFAVTPSRRRQVRFTRPYGKVSLVLIGRAGGLTLESPEDLAGRTVVVRRGSPAWERLEAMLNAMDETQAFRLQAADPALEEEDLLAAVARGGLDLTVARSNLLDVELTVREDLQPGFPLGDPLDVAWAVRPSSPNLLEAANGFLEAEYRGTFFNVLKRKYFSRSHRVARMQRERVEAQGRISPYDDLFQKYGRQIEVDWRLLAAQAYQESRFNPMARSWAGALGLMQVLPDTAQELGVKGDLRDPETGIRAGALYLRRLLDRFEPTLDSGARIRFALGAYNAGHGHVSDGRRLAEEMGFSPNLWFDHVERVLPLLSQPLYARRARYGYCRCRETVDYVRAIMERYAAYVLAVP